MLAVPNDAMYGEQWAHQNMQSELGWEIETGSSDVVIAIVDTGVVWNHPDLAANIWNNTDEIVDNGVDDDDNGFIDDVRGYDFVNLSDSSDCGVGEECFDEDNDPMDVNGHGTHCSGLAAGVTNNSIGIAGLCRDCRIMAMRAGYLSASGGGRMPTSDSSQAIVYAADNGADVISMSYGGYFPSETSRTALDYAYSKGVVLVAAAGNDDWDLMHYPSGFRNVISITATGSDDSRTFFSTYGSWTDVGAPGLNTLSTYTGDGREGSLSVIGGIELEAKGIAKSALTPGGGLTGELLHADLGYEENFTDQNFTGKIALIERGELFYDEKVKNAYDAGAVGAVLYHNFPGSFTSALSNLSDIPAVFISHEDGEYLLGLMANETIAVNMTVTGQNYMLLSGTSMACPYAAGLAGLILSKNPELSQEEVRTILRSTTNNVSSDAYIGPGTINAYRALQRDTRVIANLDYSMDYVAIGGDVEIRGTANGTDFQGYGIYYGEGVYPENWTLIDSSNAPVSNGTLAVWDSSPVAGGRLYSIRLVVTDTQGQGSEDRVLTATTYSCSNCSECSERIANASHGDVVYLTEDINSSGTCIEFDGKNDIALDCQGNGIEGLGGDEGVYMSDSYANTVRGCRISGFDYGVYLDDSWGCNISGNVLEDNDYGVE